MTATAVEAASSRPVRGFKGLIEKLRWPTASCFGGDLGDRQSRQGPWAVVSSALVDGINNGALYALIALGYTLVYGIIELINFAHGDLFMLGSVFSAFFLVNWLGASGARRDCRACAGPDAVGSGCCSADRSTSLPNAWLIAGCGGHQSSRPSSQPSDCFVLQWIGSSGTVRHRSSGPASSRAASASVRSTWTLHNSGDRGHRAPCSCC